MSMWLIYNTENTSLPKTLTFFRIANTDIIFKAWKSTLIYYITVPVTPAL